MTKISEYIQKILTISFTLVGIAILVGAVFSSDIRGNFFAFLSILFNAGLVGFFVSVTLLFSYYPVYKFIKNIFKVSSIGEALSLSVIKNGIEKKIGTAIYLGLPVCYIALLFLGVL